MDIWKLLRSVNRFHQIAREEEKRLIEQYQPFANTALDLGCGESKIPGTIGVDIDRNVHPDIVCDMAFLPIRSHCANTIISNSVLEHLHHIDQCLSEMSRASSETARFLLTITTDKELPYPDFVKKVTSIIWKMRNNFSMEKWQNLLTGHGLVVRRAERYYSIVNHMLYLCGLWFFPKVNAGRKVHIFMEARRRENK